MRHLWVGATALLLAASLGAAPVSSQQRPGPPGPPSGREMPEAMRERIRQRFAERVKEELKLTDDQANRLRGTTETFARQRQELRTQEHALRQALAGQLRPGIAANDDSVASLTEQLVDLRIRYAETFRSELKELSGYLTPVQRARLFSMRERLFRFAERGRDRQMRMHWRRDRVDSLPPQPGRP